MTLIYKHCSIWQVETEGHYEVVEVQILEVLAVGGKVYILLSLLSTLFLYIKQMIYVHVTISCRCMLHLVKGI